MAWEIHNKERPREGTPVLTLSTTGRIVFNRFSAIIFQQEKTTRVNLLWDAERLKVGIQVSRNRGLYAIRFAPKKNGAVISAASFFNYIQYDWSRSRAFPATWDDKEKILMIDIPKEHLGHPFRLSRESLKKERQTARDKTQSQAAPEGAA